MKQLRRFYAPGSYRPQQTVIIKGREAHHITRVLRMRPGDELLVLDGSGAEFHGRIKQASPQEVIVTLLSREESTPEPPVRVVLAQGIPKGDKLDLIIQKGTELGLSRLVPLSTPRSVVRPEPDWLEHRAERWRRVAAEAAKQCRRSRLPEIDRVQTLEEALRSIPSGALALIPWEGEGESWLKDLLREKADTPEVWIFIGPEGGWEPGEVAMAREAGVIPVTLGPRILRTETAALALLSILMYERGDMGERKRETSDE
ncbi:MAG: 16S rRNA (uracil(1498)-N(3))-methyltransferase [Firmicutes bacterium]|nr:16S rRNA (uracil(1498)-N(3))-methyltransferase [Bacillota bacterium]